MPGRRLDQSGFTLIELMIVVVVIGVLAAVAIPNFLSMQRKAKVGRTAQEMRSLSQAFFAYYAEHNQFPADSHESLPTGMDLYINPTVWSDGCPAGGSYNWEGPDTYGYAGLSIYPADALPSNEILMLDNMLDDGDLSQGKFRLGSNGRPTLILDEG